MLTLIDPNPWVSVDTFYKLSYATSYRFEGSKSTGSCDIDRDPRGYYVYIYLFAQQDDEDNKRGSDSE